MKHAERPTTSDRTLAIAMVLSLLLHTLFFISWPQKDPLERLTEVAIPLEMEAGPAFVPMIETWAPDLPPKVPEPPTKSKPLNRRALIKKYLDRIRKKIEHHKFSPSAEKESRLIGNAIIGFHINGNGLFENIEVLRSSGDTRLDEAAKKAVIHASGKVKRPAATGREPIRSSVVVKYQYGL